MTTKQIRVYSPSADPAQLNCEYYSDNTLSMTQPSALSCPNGTISIVIMFLLQQVHLLTSNQFSDTLFI